jgi:two-component system sensor histidine kinase HydH
VAHEIRNPLTSAILLIETCRKDPTAGGLTEEDLLLIEQELHRIESSLNTFLDFARPPKLDRRQCDLISVIREGLQLTRGRCERQNVDIRFNPSSLTLSLFGDREQLRQLVLNLILNALDAMPYGGRLEIALKVESSEVLLTISDSGAGIRADILPRLFEPFATGKETGLGLGLVICQRIVEDHGGSLKGYNLPYAGACFEVHLPVGAKS